MNALKANMDFAAGTYVFDVLRTDGGRNEELSGGYFVGEFTQVITDTALS